MAFIEGEIVVAQVDASTWALREPVVYAGNVDTFTVPAGFLTDFASVPRIFVWLLPRYGDYSKAAILHDWLLREAPISRADADGLFRRSMRELGVSLARRWMMWAAVRAASGMAGATAGDWVRFGLVAPPAIVYLIIPGLVVQTWLLLFWLVELLAWLAERLVGKRGPRPHLQSLAS